MEKCFVIQPFDNDKFDKRFIDIFQPAIEKAGFEAYRVDQDLSVKIPIDDIEKNISESSLCFAEITTDNPNVWYELGFAFACGKDVVMVCSDERAGRFPFDIQHRHVLTYRTGSTSDFNELGDTITRKIKAIKAKSKLVEHLVTTPVVETEGLKGHEIALLVLIMGDQLTPDDSSSVYLLRNEMNKSGYTNVATSVAFRSLIKKTMIETFKAVDDYSNGEEYAAVRLTEKGEAWVLSNEGQLEFRKSNSDSADFPF